MTSVSQQTGDSLYYVVLHTIWKYCMGIIGGFRLKHVVFILDWSLLQKILYVSLRYVGLRPARWQCCARPSGQVSQTIFVQWKVMISVPIRGTGVSWWSVQYSIETIRPTQKIPEADADRQRYRYLENGKKDNRRLMTMIAASSSKWLFGVYQLMFSLDTCKPPREESINFCRVERWPLCSDSTRHHGGWDTSKVFTHPFSFGFCLCMFVRFRDCCAAMLFMCLFHSYLLDVAYFMVCFHKRIHCHPTVC